MSADVTIDGLDALMANWRDGVAELGRDARAAVSSALSVGKARAKSLAHVKTGALRREITGKVTSSNAMGATGELFAAKLYASYFQDGTRAHPIPNAWGRGITVHHPGTSPHPFMDDAERLTDVELTRHMERAEQRLLSRMR